MSKLVYKKPTTPSRRHQLLLDRSSLNKIKILKNQSLFIKNKAGRNNQGNITVFTKGGGHKKKYRIVLHKRGFLFGIVESIEYDPYRSSNLARVFSEEANLHFYILAPEGLKKGHFVKSHIERKGDLRFKIGDFYCLKDLPLGVFVHNIPFPRKGGVARSAGCSAQIISKDSTYCRLRLSSGEHRLFFLHTTATLGTLSNALHKRVVLGKAGRSRWLNRRPSVRGVAMNPIDHPHGGGEGKTSGGRPSVTPWGKVAHGQPTQSKKYHNLIVKKRKKC